MFYYARQNKQVPPHIDLLYQISTGDSYTKQENSIGNLTATTLLDLTGKVLRQMHSSRTLVKQKVRLISLLTSLRHNLCMYILA